MYTRAVSYMNDCLTGKKELPDAREKLHNWDIFTSMMLAAWIRRFTKENKTANAVAARWAKVITAAFADDSYNHEKYTVAYQAEFGLKPSGGRLVDFVSFYQVSLLSDCLDEKTELAVMDYILHKDDGIYYIYSGRLCDVPKLFESKSASRYLGAMELLAEYPYGKKKLAFVVDRLSSNRNVNGKWDMGKTVNDKVYFPLSDNWRKKRHGRLTARSGFAG